MNTLKTKEDRKIDCANGIHAFTIKLKWHNEITINCIDCKYNRTIPINKNSSSLFWHIKTTIKRVFIKLKLKLKLKLQLQRKG